MAFQTGIMDFLESRMATAVKAVKIHMLILWVIPLSDAYPTTKVFKGKKSYEDKTIHESIVLTEKKVRNNPSAEHAGELLNKFGNSHIIIKCYEVCKINKGSIKVKKKCIQF